MVFGFRIEAPFVGRFCSAITEISRTHGRGTSVAKDDLEDTPSQGVARVEQDLGSVSGFRVAKDQLKPHPVSPQAPKPETQTLIVQTPPANPVNQP